MTRLLHAYRQQMRTAGDRGIDWAFTFETWLAVWDRSGFLSLRGRGRGKYVMARRGDVGPYAIGNVTIQLYEENCRDSRRNNPHQAGQLCGKPVGGGRGWTFHKGAYQVVVCRTYIGRFRTQMAAEEAYRAACEAHALTVRQQKPNGAEYIAPSQRHAELLRIATP